MATGLTKVKPEILSTGAPQWNETGFHTFPTNDTWHGVGLELNFGVQSTQGYAYIDFHSTNATEDDFDARIIKDSQPGQGDVFLFENKGEGNMTFQLNEAERLRIESDGKIVANTLSTDKIIDNKSLVTKEYVDNRRGNFKKATESESGKHSTIAPQYSDSFCYIDDEDDVIAGGNGNGQHRMGGGMPDKHMYRSKFMLPDGEKSDKLYITNYNLHVITKTGKCFSTGSGYGAAALTNTSSHHSTSKFNDWTRSYCESDNCRINKVVASGDIDSHSTFALDDLGYFWGHGVNQYGCLANGTTVNSNSENVAQVGSNTIIGKREALANSETSAIERPYNLATNRRYLPHVMNPMLDANGNITTTVNSAVSLLKVTDATHVGSHDGSVHPDTVAILGEDKRVYVAGYCNHGQAGAGVTVTTQSNWSTVQTSAGVPLENITKLYSGGENAYTYFVAIDENYDVWSWGDNGGKQLGVGNVTTDKNEANKVWDASARGFRANYILTNNAGSSNDDAFVIIASHQRDNGTETSKRFWVCNNNAFSNGTFTQMTHTVFDTAVYTIQDLYYSSGNTNNFYYVLARNNTTNELELYSSGSNSKGQLGYQNPNDPTDFVNKTTDGNTVSYRVNFSPELLEKVVTIQCNRQHNEGGNTFIHLSDGRIFGCGRIRWHFGTHVNNTNYYKFTPISMDGI